MKRGSLWKKVQNADMRNCLLYTSSVVFSTNSDITYRMYDYERDDPKRPLHLKQAFEGLNMPETDLKPHNIIDERCV